MQYLLYGWVQTYLLDMSEICPLLLLCQYLILCSFIWTMNIWYFMTFIQRVLRISYFYSILYHVFEIAKLKLSLLPFRIIVLYCFKKKIELGNEFDNFTQENTILFNISFSKKQLSMFMLHWIDTYMCRFFLTNPNIWTLLIAWVGIKQSNLW